MMKNILLIMLCLYSCNAITHPTSWTHPQLEVRLSANGNGLFTTSSVAKGTLLAVFGGTIMNKEDIASLDESSCRNILQIADNLWIGTGLPTSEPADFINHSCSPNAGIQGQICLVAMRDIDTNEEITFDYATVLTQWIGMDAIECNCGSSECRKLIRGDDWRLPTLQKKYDGYFSHYIQKKIEKGQQTLQNILNEYLAYELNDAEIAQELSTLLVNHILNWKAPTIEPKQINSIIAFAFGNRILPNGNRLPGPVNEVLADLVVKLHQETNAHVYAQWEIAECIGNQIPAQKMSIIYPKLDAQANVIYLSTAGVIAEIIKDVCNPERLGTVAIVAFNDHLYRCITLAHAACIDAYAPANYSMPREYDLLSGQPWTRDRLTYLITDMKARINNYLENTN